MTGPQVQPVPALPSVVQQQQGYFSPGPDGAPPDGPPPIYPTAPQLPAQVATPPAGPQGVPWVQPAPAGAPAPPQAPSQAPVGIDPNARFGTGFDVPLELRGRTLAEGMRIYDGMKNVVLNGMPTPQPPPTVPVAVQPDPQRPEGFNWQNPEASFARIVDERIQKTLMPALQPLIQGQQFGSVKTARDQVASEIPFFTRIEPQVFERLRGADAATLADPRVWRLAAESVVGGMAMRGQLPAQQQQPRSNGASAPINPSPNLGGFFTEAPTTGSAPGGGPQLSAKEDFVRQQMGMDTDTWALWKKGGVPPTGGAR